ncbi:MAG TPA: hypothetical protein VJS44_06270, partial [Pyrinomonadaceae bacterium]|nr:hypothetical protein [Pyrinomonadaceae bacterium]
MSKAIRPIIAALFLLAASFTIFVVRDRGQGVSAQAQSGLPQGKWTYSASPYTGAGYESSPVV